MSYDYQREKQALFTDEGQKTFLKVRDNAHRLLEMSGVADMQSLWRGLSGDNWELMACVERLVELGELVEVPQQGDVFAQHRIFKWR